MSKRRTWTGVHLKEFLWATVNHHLQTFGDSKLVPTEPKKTVLESLAAVVSALGGTRTPISQALVEVGLFVGLIAGAGWVYEHANPSVKPLLAMFFMFFGFFVGFGLLIRVMVSIIGSFPKINQK